MVGWQTLVLLIVAGSCTSAGAQTQPQFWPELNIFVQQNPRLRFVFQDSLRQDLDTHSVQGNFAYFIDVAMRPLLRRDLRWRDDVFRSRFLTFRGGYQYSTNLANGHNNSENRAIIELTPRYVLPAGIVLSDRNRGEFRFIKGQGFSTRYRNRLRAERDLGLGRFVFTPFAYDEIFYDTRYDVWNRNRYAFGVYVPIGPHVVIETYYLRQNDSRSRTPRIKALGLTLNLYF
jgi:hypothetical protein